jgi:hypothetical protein
MYYMTLSEQTEEEKEYSELIINNKVHLNGDSLLVKDAKIFSGCSHIILPKSFLGKKVLVIEIDKIEIYN